MVEKQTDISQEISAEALDLIKKGHRAWQARRYREAKTYLEEALEIAHAKNSVYGILGAKHLLGNIAFNECNDEKSRLIHEEVMAQSRTIGYEGGVASSLANLAVIDIVAGHYDQARRKYEESIVSYEAGGFTAEAKAIRELIERYIVRREPLNIHRTCD